MLRTRGKKYEMAAQRLYGENWEKNTCCKMSLSNAGWWGWACLDLIGGITTPYS